MNKKGVEESFPFDESTLVFKVMNKMFALLPLNSEVPRVNLKANPAWSEELRESFPQIYGAFHMNKKHWNSVEFENCIDEELLITMIDHSYDCVVYNLTKKAQRELKVL